MKKISWKTLVTLIVTVVTVMIFGSMNVLADELTEPVGGECGNGLTWSLDVEGNLTISGTGAMEYESCPWSEYADKIKTVTIEQGVTSIASGAFSSLSNLKKAIIADSVTSIGMAGFAGSNNLSEINLPDSITEIGAYSFTNTALVNVTLPSNLQTVQMDLFSGCLFLESVYIPDSVTVIEESVFAGSSIQNVRLPAGLTYIPKGMFARSDIKTIELPSSIREIKEAAFNDCDLTKITLPEGLVTIGNDAFSSCNSLKSVSLPSTLRSIGANAFIYTRNLESITIPGNVNQIQDKAFYQSGIKNLVFKEGDDHFYIMLGPSSFADCTRLKTIEFSSAIRIPSKDAFYSCSQIDSIVLNFAPSLIDSDFDFADTIKTFYSKEQIVCYVPTAYLDEYKTLYANLGITFKGDTEDVGIGDVLAGYTLSLEGDIGVNFYLRFNDIDALSNDAKMVFTIASINGQKTRTCEVYVKPQTDSSRSVATQDNGYYVFKCLVNAKEMTSIITAQVVDGEAKGTAYTYTVQDYAKYMLAHANKFEKEQDLIKAMLNYGCACQVYFDYNLENPANSIMGTSDQDYGFLTESDINASPRPEDLTIEGTDIKIDKASLVLNTTSVLKLFITGADENTVFKYGDDVLTPVKSGEYYVITIDGISAQYIKMAFHIKVFDGDKRLGYLSYSPLYYFRNVLKSDIDPNGPITYNLKVLVSMMYKYGDAASKYNPPEIG